MERLQGFRLFSADMISLECVILIEFPLLLGRIISTANSLANPRDLHTPNHLIEQEVIMREGEIIFIAFVYFISASLSVGHLLQWYLSTCNQFLDQQRIVR